MHSATRKLALAISLSLLAGCAGRNCCSSNTSVAPQAFDCQPVDSAQVRYDVSAVTPQDSANIFGHQQLCALGEQQAQCLAARYTPIANLMVLEAQAVEDQPNGSPLTAAVLRLEATQRRNMAAADALQLYLQLTEANGGVENLAHRNEAVELMISDVKGIQDRGLLAPISKPEVEGQRLELWHRRVETQATIDQLNYQLQATLGVDPGPTARFWPQPALTVSTVVPDRDEAVRIAMTNRTDLAAARLLANSDSEDSAAAARTLLALSGTGLGASPPRLALLLHPGARDEENATRAQQMAELVAERTRTVRNETLQAVMLIDMRLSQIGLTRQRLSIAQEHASAVEEQLKLTGGGPLTVRKARLDMLAAEQDLLHDVMQWKLAWVKLKEAQGLLAIECGFNAASHVCPSPACCPQQ